MPAPWASAVRDLSTLRQLIQVW